MDGIEIADRHLETARQLRAAVEETRQALQISRDLVARSRRQTQAAMTTPNGGQVPHPDDAGPSKPLVECLIQAYELAEDDSDHLTRTLLGHVLTHVGRRIANVIGPRAAEIVVH